METMERDPLYIAEQMKFIRKMHRLTQENLADAAGLSSRTIEKIESAATDRTSRPFAVSPAPSSWT